MPDPTDARRDRLLASYAELARVAGSLSAAVASFKMQLAEQEQALDEARNAEPLRRLEATIARLSEKHAADLRGATMAADESARDAARFESERDAARLRADDAERRVRLVEADLKKARAERDAARGEAAPLGGAASRRAVLPAKPALPKPRATPPAAKPSAAPAAPVSRGPALYAVDVAIADAFRAWCVAASAVMGKVGFFAEALRQKVPGATASAVYRDANSQAQPIAFGSGGSSPVEYWLVAVEGRHWLFPQPLSPGQFRELAPCFDGVATPATLAAIRPAEVKASADRFDLGPRGHVA